MASGVPVVAGNNSGYSCVMKERGLLSLVNPKDTDDFKRRLNVFLRDKELQKLWLEWAEDYVLQFDSHKIIDQYEAVYEKVLKEYDKVNA